MSGLLEEWQEELAANDDGSRPVPSAAEQDKMISDWNRLINTKETELRAVHRRDLREIFASTWAPAHLSGWWTPSGPLEEDDDPFADRQDGTSPEVEAFLL